MYILNLNKCSTIMFSLKKRPIQFNYSLSNVNTVNDLGVKFNSKLFFNDYINFISNKAAAKLGFLKRTCRGFRDESTLKILNNSLIRLHLDCALIYS